MDTEQRDSRAHDNSVHRNEFGYMESVGHPIGNNILNKQRLEPSASSTTHDATQESIYQTVVNPVETHRFSTHGLNPPSRAPPPIPQSSINMPKPEKTDAPSAEPKVPIVPRTPRTPTSGFGSLFRKRLRSHHGGGSKMPTTPVAPSTHWNPFENQDPVPPCSSIWMTGRLENKSEKMERAAYFREKVEKQMAQGEVAHGKSPARKQLSIGKAQSKEDLRRKNRSLARRQSMESIAAPEPLFSASPPPPLPALPGSSRLNYLDGRAKSRVADDAAAAVYKAKKPQHLSVETRKLRKQAREGSRATRAPNSKPSSGGLRSAFKTESSRLSGGGVTGEESREDEVVARRQ
ncbi:hypothetical protein EDB81DRAFT_883815 [Dactylonectria macrodidyma]|uniref:Uncharacterized protein n=1 Tax=Dactylonectria macrodidyma TaxID=307937 RepID=A0A9P9EW33_9HYPO|nr:hypothetical protein EDB81DRAFT_883815 [Dactylonectria macrodidyma]